MSHAYKSAPEEKLEKEDKRYLNSKARVVKTAISHVVSLIVITILMMAIAAYMKYGNLDNFMEQIDGIKSWFEPGGMLFNAIIGYLPVIVISCVGAYFGEGTVGKMVFGLVKIVAILIWLLLIFQGASTSLQLPDAVTAIGLEDFTIGIEGLTKFATLVLTCALLIPIGEFAGARKRHKRALAKKKRLD